MSLTGAGRKIRAPWYAVAALHLVLGFFAVLTLIPFFWLVAASLKKDTFGSLFLPPMSTWSTELGFDNFRRLFSELGFFRYMINSGFLAAASTLISMTGSLMAGFALAKYKFRGQALIMAVMLVSLMIPGEVLLGPTFDIIYRLHWTDSYWGLLAPGLASTFAILFYRQAFLNIPDELLEAARIDGAGELRVAWEIAVPQVRPMIGALSLAGFLGGWNSFLWPQIILRTQEKMPLPVALAQLTSVYQTEYGLIMAGTLASIIPVVLVFMLFQKDFISGLTQGAIK